MLRKASNNLLVASLTKETFPERTTKPDVEWKLVFTEGFSVQVASKKYRKQPPGARVNEYLSCETILQKGIFKNTLPSGSTISVLFTQ